MPTPSTLMEPEVVVMTNLGASSDEKVGIMTTLCFLSHSFTLTTYHQTSNMSHTLVGNKIVDHSEVVGASPVSAAPTTSSFST